MFGVKRRPKKVERVVRAISRDGNWPLGPE